MASFRLSDGGDPSGLGPAYSTRTHTKSHIHFGLPPREGRGVQKTDSLMLPASNWYIVGIYPCGNM
eukprot:103759-Prorocentrum_minimum.AAC.1